MSEKFLKMATILCLLGSANSALAFDYNQNFKPNECKIRVGKFLTHLKSLDRDNDQEMRSSQEYANFLLTGKCKSHFTAGGISISDALLVQNAADGFVNPQANANIAGPSNGAQIPLIGNKAEPKNPPAPAMPEDVAPPAPAMPEDVAPPVPPRDYKPADVPPPPAMPAGTASKSQGTNKNSPTNVDEARKGLKPTGLDTRADLTGTHMDHFSKDKEFDFLKNHPRFKAQHDASHGNNDSDSANHPDDWMQ